jgi:hypothetical protein
VTEVLAEGLGLEDVGHGGVEFGARAGGEVEF